MSPGAGWGKCEQLNTEPKDGANHISVDWKGPVPDYLIVDGTPKVHRGGMGSSSYGSLDDSDDEGGNEVHVKLRQFFGIVCAESKPTQVAFAFLGSIVRAVAPAMVGKL